MARKKESATKKNRPLDSGKPAPQAQQSGGPAATTASAAQSDVASYPLSAQRSEKGKEVRKSVSAKASLGADQQSSESGHNLAKPGGDDLSKAPSAPADAPAAPHTSHAVKPTPGAAPSAGKPTSTDKKHTATTTTTSPSSASQGNRAAPGPTDVPIDTVITVTRDIIDATSGGNSQAELEEAAAPGPETPTAMAAAAATATAAAIAANTSGSVVVTTAPLPTPAPAAGDITSAAAPAPAAAAQHSTTTDRQAHQATPPEGNRRQHSSTVAEGTSELKDNTAQQAGRESPSDSAGAMSAAAKSKTDGSQPAPDITPGTATVTGPGAARLQPVPRSVSASQQSSQQLPPSTKQLSASAFDAGSQQHHSAAQFTSSSSTYADRGDQTAAATEAAATGSTPGALGLHNAPVNLRSARATDTPTDSSMNGKAPAQQLHPPTPPAAVRQQDEGRKPAQQQTFTPAALTESSMGSSSGGRTTAFMTTDTPDMKPVDQEVTGREGGPGDTQLTAAHNSKPPQQGLQAVQNTHASLSASRAHKGALPGHVDKVPVSYSSSSSSTGPTRTAPFTAPPTLPPYDAEVTEEAGATIAAIAAAASSIKAFPPQLLPAVGTSPGLTSQHMEVLSVWYTKFCFDTEAQQQAALQQHCEQDMQFEDNFIKVSGRAKVGVQFYALKRLLRGIELAPEKIELLPVAPASPTYKLRIISRIAFQFYNFKWFPLMTLMFPVLLLLPTVIDTWATDELTVRKEDNRIIAYKQRVHNIPTAPTVVRWLLGHATSWMLMYTLGW